MSYEKNARVINDDIFDLINSCFEKKRNSRNINSRCNFLMNTRIILFLTDDGSYSIKSKRNKSQS